MAQLEVEKTFRDNKTGERVILYTNGDMSIGKTFYYPVTPNMIVGERKIFECNGIKYVVPTTDEVWERLVIQSTTNKHTLKASLDSCMQYIKQITSPLNPKNRKVRASQKRLVGLISAMYGVKPQTGFIKKFTHLVKKAGLPTACVLSIPVLKGAAPQLLRQINLYKLGIADSESYIRQCTYSNLGEAMNAHQDAVKSYLETGYIELYNKCLDGNGKLDSDKFVEAIYQYELSQSNPQAETFKFLASAYYNEIWNVQKADITSGSWTEPTNFISYNYWLAREGLGTSPKNINFGTTLYKDNQQFKNAVDTGDDATIEAILTKVLIANKYSTGYLHEDLSASNKSYLATYIKQLGSTKTKSELENLSDVELVREGAIAIGIENADTMTDAQVFGVSEKVFCEVLWAELIKTNGQTGDCPFETYGEYVKEVIINGEQYNLDLGNRSSCDNGLFRMMLRMKNKELQALEAEGNGVDIDGHPYSYWINNEGSLQEYALLYGAEDADIFTMGDTELSVYNEIQTTYGSEYGLKLFNDNNGYSTVNVNKNELSKLPQNIRDEYVEKLNNAQLLDEYNKLNAQDGDLTDGQVDLYTLFVNEMGVIGTEDPPTPTPEDIPNDPSFIEKYGSYLVPVIAVLGLIAATALILTVKHNANKCNKAQQKSMDIPNEQVNEKK